MFHEESFVVLNVVVTAAKIVPEWFYLWLFGVIKGCPSKAYGVCALVCVVLLVLVCCVYVVFVCCVRCVVVSVLSGLWLLCSFVVVGLCSGLVVLV